MFENKKRVIKICLMLFVLLVFNASAERCVLSISQITTLYFGVEIDLPHPEHPYTIPTAHTDIEIPLRFAMGWDVHINTADTRVETEEALFRLGTEHRASFSGSVSPGFQFIGVGPNETFWYYNQSQAPAPGFDSQDIISAEANQLCFWDPNDSVHNATGLQKWLQVNLIEVRGPAGGHVSMWQENGENPFVFFSTHEGGITDEDVYYIKANQHAHNSWAFTKPGFYEVDIQVSTQHFCDESLTADLNDDCIVNLEDFTLMAGQWLACGSSFNPECP